MAEKNQFVMTREGYEKLQEELKYQSETHRAEVAEKMLRDNNIHNVRISHFGVMLTDHFNPQNMTVNLRDSVYSSRSIAAAAVACHACGHTLQHARG